MCTILAHCFNRPQRLERGNLRRCQARGTGDVHLFVGVIAAQGAQTFPARQGMTSGAEADKPGFVAMPGQNGQTLA